jgi:rhodanese-related sulfurtransferase
VERKEALLCCPYEASHCSGTHLEGSITLEELESQLSSLPRSRTLIFYCGCPKEADAAARAAEFAARGFDHVAVVDGGILAWINAGYGVTSRSGEPPK